MFYLYINYIYNIAYLYIIITYTTHTFTLCIHILYVHIQLCKVDGEGVGDQGHPEHGKRGRGITCIYVYYIYM